MKLLFDFLPIVLFFVTYKLYTIYIATAVLIAASIIQSAMFYAKHKTIDTTQAVTLLFVTVLGSATLYFQNEIFIKWKPTIVYWVLALLFFFSKYVGNKTILIKRIFASANIELTSELSWHKLNLAWCIFFIALGFTNLFIAYNYSTSTWVNFKLFGILIIIVLFTAIQAIYIHKNLKPDHKK